jgi:hypothetical protein
LKKGDLGGFKKTSNQKEFLANAIRAFLRGSPADWWQRTTPAQAKARGYR